MLRRNYKKRSVKEIELKCVDENMKSETENIVIVMRTFRLKSSTLKLETIVAT